jgi:hypothetical protein
VVVVKFSCGHAVYNRKLMQSVDSISFAQCSDGENALFFCDVRFHRAVMEVVFLLNV